MARVYRGERVLPHARLRAARAAHLPRASASTPTRSRTGRPTRARRSSSARCSSSSLYVILRTQGIHPFNPEGFDSGTWDVTFNTDVLVHHEHELAVLRRRDDADVLLADGRAGRAELRLRGGRHGRARRGDPRLRQPRRRAARQLLAGPRPDAALHPAAALVRRRAGARLPGRDPDPQRLGRPTRRPRALEQTLALGPAASQIAIKQLGTNGGGFFNVNSALPFENATGLLELRRDAVHPADPGGADRHLRAHGRQPPPGLGAVRGDGAMFVVASIGGGLRGRAARLAGAAQAGVRRVADGTRRQPGGQGAALRDRRQRARGRAHDRRLERLGQLGATTRTPAPAAPCRSST